MEKETVFARLTVLFEEPFWVGIYERSQGNRLEACKITFGGEPGDGEVLAWLLDHWRELRFSPAVEGELPQSAPKNPKRARRKARKQSEEGRGVGTKAQQALQLMREQNRAERAVRLRGRREKERQRRYLLRQRRKKEKHRTG